jgi:hypothetical protein
MYKAFKNWVGTLTTNQRYPHFDEEHGYFLIRKDNVFEAEISDNWDGFKAGWEARECVDERTVRGW